MASRTRSQLGAPMTTALVVCLTTLSLAQSPAFEVASVRPVVNDGMFRFSFLPGGQLLVSGASPSILIQRAYRLPAARVVGVPAWAATERFAIRAKAFEGAPSTTSDVLGMLQALLGERFQLRTHRESRELPAYVLERESADDPLGWNMVASQLDCGDMVPGSTGAADGECQGRVALWHDSVRALHAHAEGTDGGFAGARPSAVRGPSH